MFEQFPKFPVRATAIVPNLKDYSKLSNDKSSVEPFFLRASHHSLLPISFLSKGFRLGETTLNPEKVTGQSLYILSKRKYVAFFCRSTIALRGLTP